MKVVLQDLTKIFPSRNKNDHEVVAVNKFNFEIPDGKLIGLLGPSGCGKSTTLYMICGLQNHPAVKFSSAMTTLLNSLQKTEVLVWYSKTMRCIHT